MNAREEAPITVVDTVGAGDCFLAGLITALLAGPERGEEALAPRAGGLTDPVTEARLRAVLHHALASASHCVERAGCTPPRYEEVRERLALRRPTTAEGR